jgi:hypothetical protein
MKDGEKSKQGLIIKILIAIILLLALVLIYFFIIKPSVDNYVLNKQIEAQQYIFANMIAQLQSTGAYQLAVGNQTLVLVPYAPQAAQ